MDPTLRFHAEKDTPSFRPRWKIRNRDFGAISAKVSAGQRFRSIPIKSAAFCWHRNIRQKPDGFNVQNPSNPKMQIFAKILVPA
jgi:hypothetical protein